MKTSDDSKDEDVGMIKLEGQDDDNSDEDS